MHTPLLAALLTTASTVSSQSYHHTMCLPTETTAAQVLDSSLSQPCRLPVMPHVACQPTCLLRKVASRSPPM